MKLLHIASDSWKEIFGKTEEYMKIFFSDNNPSVEQLHYWLTPHGDYNVTNNPFEVKDADFIMCWCVTQMGQAQRIHNANKHVPLINYNWDIYEWAIKTP